MQKVIILPGLGDHMDHAEWATRNWPRIGLQPIVCSMGWRNGEHFATKFEKLLALVDEHFRNGNPISVIGLSAGGSAALNLFAARSDRVKYAISICGRLRQGDEFSFRKRTRTSPAFAESVLLFEQQEKMLSEEQRKKIMTVRARFGDELVPADTATVRGAQNVTIPTIEHSLTIYLALDPFSKIITDYVKSGAVM